MGEPDDRAADGSAELPEASDVDHEFDDEFGDADTTAAASDVDGVETTAETFDDPVAADVDLPDAPAAVGGVDPRQVLDTLSERPLSEHAEVYEELHTHLQRTLAEIDGG